MVRDIKNRSNVAGGFANQLAADKKKAVLAIGLIALMVFMWIKVIIKKGPSDAAAVTPKEQLNQKSGDNQDSDVTFVQLPVVSGRNDVITRDFFASDEWKSFVNKQGNKQIGKQEVNVISGNDKAEVLKKVAEKLKLEAALVMGGSAVAYINDKVMAVGDKLVVANGADSFECEIVKIEENMVVIGCEEAEIILKLPQVMK